MKKCPHCSSSEPRTKAGRTRTGSQRYKCRECRRVYTPEPKPLGYPDQTKREAVRLYLEGTNFRRIGRLLSVNHQSVVNWVNAYHASLPAAEQPDRKSTRLNSSHTDISRMPSSALKRH